MGEIPSQGTPFETVISHLAASQIPGLPPVYKAF
jgi:hypothetical protein